LIPRIGNAEGTLTRHGLPGDGRRRIVPADNAELLAVIPVCGLAVPGIGDREGTVGWAAAAGYGAAGIVPPVHAEVAAAVLGHDDQITKVSILDRQFVEAAPVAACAHQGEAHPGLPLQRGNAVHWAGGFDISRQRHAAENVADRAQALLLRLVQEGRHLLDVAGDQQEALARLSQAAELAAVVSGFGNGVAVETQQAVDLVEQVPATGGQSWYVLEDDQRNRVVFPGFTHQPYAAQGQFDQRLVLRGLAHFLGEQTAGALAGAADEHCIGALVLCRPAHVIGGSLAPTCRRLFPVAADVLLAGEQLLQGAWHSDELLEIAQACQVNVDSAKAFPARLYIPDNGFRAV